MEEIEYRVPFLLGRMSFPDEERAENTTAQELLDYLAGYSTKMVVDRQRWHLFGGGTMLPTALPLYLRREEVPYLCFLRGERPVGAFHDIRLQVQGGIMEIWGDLELDADHPLVSGLLSCLQMRTDMHQIDHSYFGNRLRLWEHQEQSTNQYVQPYRTPDKGRYEWPPHRRWAGFILDIRNWL